MSWAALLRLIGPYVLAGSVGFGMAWWVQGVRLDASRNETAEVQNAFLTYHNRQIEIALEKERAQQARQVETDKQWKENLDVLGKDRDVYRRCVLAGKCGGLRNNVPAAEPAGNGVRVPAAGGPDAAGGGPVPAPGEPAPQVILDCARVQLRLNTLQGDIERQPGYTR